LKELLARPNLPNLKYSESRKFANTTEFLDAQRAFTVASNFRNFPMYHQQR